MIILRRCCICKKFLGIKFNYIKYWLRKKFIEGYTDTYCDECFGRKQKEWLVSPEHINCKCIIPNINTIYDNETINEIANNLRRQNISIREIKIIIKAAIKLSAIKAIDLNTSINILLPVYKKGKLIYAKRYGLNIKATKSKKENYKRILKLIRKGVK